MKEEINEPVILWCDNKSAINISKNPMMYIKTKHIAIKYHYLRELVQDKEVKMEYVNTQEKIYDIFTKALPKDAYEYLRGKVRVIPLSMAIQVTRGMPYIKQADVYMLHIDVEDLTLGAA